LDHNSGFNLDIFGLMHENLEKIKGFFKDEQSFFAAKQLLFETDEKLPRILLYRIIDSIRDAIFVID